MNIEDIKKEIQEGSAYLVDVRSTEEYEESHADNSINHDINDLMHGVELTDSNGKRIENDKKVYLVCASGARAMVCESILKKMGYVNVKAIGSYYEFK